MLRFAWLSALRSLFRRLRTSVTNPRKPQPHHLPQPGPWWTPHRSRDASVLRLARLEPLEPRDLPSVFGLGGPAADNATSVKLDTAGNEYVCGSFSGYPGAVGVAVDFDPGPGTTPLTNADTTADAFVAKYSPSGQLLWVGQLPNGTATALTLDGNGNVLVTGSFTGTTDFDFGPGSTTLTAGSNGSAFVAKYTANGGLVWTDGMGSATVLGVAGDTITVDGSGNVYSAGVFGRGTADFDPGSGTFNLTNSSGNANTYISKLDASGNFVWAKQFANDPTVAAGVWPEDMGVDGNQQVYISGLFSNHVNFDTSGGAHWVTAADAAAANGGYGDGYVARLTATGDLDYVVTMGSAGGRDDGYGIAVDSAGDAYATGRYSTTTGQPATPLTITPATGTGTQLPLAGSSDAFIMKLNTTGGLAWARSIGGPGFDGGQSIAIGPDGLYLTGNFSGTVDFDPNAGVQNVTGGATDDFILKLATDSTFLNVWTVGDGTVYAYANDIAVNDSGAVGVVGRFQGSGDFEPGSGVTTLTSAGNDDAFVVLMSGPDHPPVASGGSLTTNEDTAASGTLSATDVDGDTLTYALVSGPAHGTLTAFNAATGAFTYKPAPNYNGPDSFTFKANDGKADSNTATVSITVNPVNDPPVPFPVVQNVTTPEDTALPGQVAGKDVDGDPLTFTLDTGPQHGALAFNADGTFTYTPNLNFNGTDGFLFRVVDSHGAVSNLGGVSITVTPVNDAPTANDDAYSVNEDGVLTIAAPAPVTRLRMVSDPGDFVGQGQTYDFTPANITFAPPTTNFDNGVSLSLTQPAPGTEFWTLDFAAADNAVLTPGTYLDAQRFPFQAAGHPGLDVAGDGRRSNTLTGQFTVYDVGLSGGTVQSFAAAFEQHYAGGGPALVGWVMYNTTFGTGAGVLANDTDVEGDLLLGAALVAGPKHGTLAFNGDGTFTYTPDPNFNGTDSFTYRTNDGRADSNVATVTITVNPVNDAPVAAGAAVTTGEGRAVSGQVAATDVDGDPLTYALVSGPAHGAVTLNADGTYTYTPAASFSGPDSFTYKANDGKADSNTATVSITVTPDHPPAATGEAYQTSEGVQIFTAAPGLLANDTDPDGDPLTAVLVNPPAHGTVVLNADGSFIYTPAADYDGPDSFTYAASDGILSSDPVTVSLTVTDNEPPVAADDEFTMTQGTSLTFTPADLVANDTDPDGDPLWANLIALPLPGDPYPRVGQLVITEQNFQVISLLYTPPTDFTGTAFIEYRPSDGKIVSDNIGVIRVHVVAPPAPPVSAADAYATDEDTPLTVAAPGVLANDSDPNGDPMTAVLVAGPAHGTLALNANGGFTYTPAANYNGPDSFAYKANDGTGDGNTVTVSLSVRPVNDAPVASNLSVTTPEDTAVFGQVAATDVDSTGLTFALVSGPAHGTLALNGDGTFTYTPAANYNGPDSFTFKANDGALDSAPATVSITVTPVNDPPVAAGQSVTMQAGKTVSGTVTATDVDSPTLTFALVSGPAHGTATVNADGSFTYTAAATYSGPDAFTFKANDGTADSNVATVSITVTPANKAPVAANQSVTTKEDTSVSGKATATDADGDSLTFMVVTGPAHGSVTMKPDGSFTYTPAANYNGTDSFTFKANDGQADSNTATVSIAVTPVNDAPTLAPATFLLPEKSPKGTVVGTVTGADVDGDKLAYSIVAGNTDGAFAINAATGQITVANTGALNAKKNPSFTLTVQVRDPGGLTGTGTVTVLLATTGGPHVAIDILPHDDANRINANSNGTIDVAILSTADFSALSVNVFSLKFGRTGQENSLSQVSFLPLPKVRIADVDGDGRPDLVVTFETEDTGFRPGDTNGVLTGELWDGTAFTATDDVTVKNNRGK